MRARVFGLRNAFRLRNAPATEREFNVSRTALDLTVEFSFVLNVAVRAVLRVTADRVPVLRAVERATLPPELVRVDERDTADLVLTCAPPPPPLTWPPPPACAPPPPPPPPFAGGAA